MEKNSDKIKSQYALITVLIIGIYTLIIFIHTAPNNIVSENLKSKNKYLVSFCDQNWRLFASEPETVHFRYKYVDENEKVSNWIYPLEEELEKSNVLGLKIHSKKALGMYNWLLLAYLYPNHLYFKKTEEFVKNHIRIEEGKETKKIWFELSLNDYPVLRNE